MPFALVLILLAAAWRVFGVHVPELSNFSPLMALTFCGAAYFKDKRLWLVPFAALLLSDLYIDRYYALTYGYTWEVGATVIRLLCFAFALVLGALVARRRNALNLLSGALGGSLFFYLVTNSTTWLTDVTYAKTAAGWWQALTIGHPEFPPTLLFFRNTLVSDLLFTGLFAGVMEFARRRAAERDSQGLGAATRG